MKARGRCSRVRELAGRFGRQVHRNLQLGVLEEATCVNLEPVRAYMW